MDLEDYRRRVLPAITPPFLLPDGLSMARMVHIIFRAVSQNLSTPLYIYAGSG